MPAARQPHSKWLSRTLLVVVRLPADHIETLVPAETSVGQAKASKWPARRPRLSRRPFDTEPSEGHTETRRSGAVVLECRFIVSVSICGKTFCQVL